MSTDTVPVTPQTTDDYVMVHAKHPLRWIAGILLVGLFILLAISAVTNPRFRWDVIALYVRDGTLLSGIVLTLGLTVISMLVGIILGVILAIMRLSVNPVVRSAAGAYVYVFRGTPVLVQLLMWFGLSSLYPDITFGIPGVHLDANVLITPLLAAILGLGLNEAAYQSEIVRAGILSVDEGQSEASGALGLTRMQTMRKVVLPQAMRVIIPPTGNEIIGMLKTTSLVSVLAVPELLYSAQIIYSKNLQVMPLLIVASIWYILITTVFNIGQSCLERRFSRGTTRTVVLPWHQRLARYFRVHSPIAIRKGK